MSTLRTLFWTLLFINVYSSYSMADTSCVSSFSELKSQSTEFPSAFQKLPALFTTDGFLVTAALKIRAVGDRLKLDSHVWKPGDIYYDESYIKKVCYDGKSLIVTFESGKTFDSKINDKNELSTQGVTLDKSDEKTYARIANKVNEAIQKKESKKSGLK